MKSGDFLHTDLEHRGATGNVRFGVMALLDGPGDSTMDVTIRWPDDDSREEVGLGTIAITGLEAGETCATVIFYGTKQLSRICRNASKTATPSARPGLYVSTGRPLSTMIEVAAELSAGWQLLSRVRLEPGDPVVPPAARLLFGTGLPSRRLLASLI